MVIFELSRASEIRHYSLKCGVQPGGGRGDSYVPRGYNIALRVDLGSYYVADFSKN